MFIKKLTLGSGIRALKNFVSGIDIQINDYLDSLKTLNSDLQLGLMVQGSVITYRVFDDIARMNESIKETGSF